MSEQQMHGLSFINVGGADFIDKSPTIRMLVNKYMDSKGAGEDEKYSVDAIMNIMGLASHSKSMFILLAEKDGTGVGLMTAHAITHDDVKKGGMIHIGVVDENLSKKESNIVITEGMRRLSIWAEDNDMKSIFAQTQRSEQPFDRLLMKHGWKRITTVYEKEISHGKAKDSPAAAIGPATTGVPGVVV